LKEHLFNKIDIIIVPIILLSIHIFLVYFKRKQEVGIQKYLFFGAYLRVLGTFLISAITEFYYTYGDTYVYYQNSQLLRSFFLEDPLGWAKLIFSNPVGNSIQAEKYIDIVSNYDAYATAIFKTPENATLCKIASIFNIFCFDSYLGMALLFGLFSFLGCWYIYKTFIHFFPGYEKQYAWLCIFLPSLWFWGSGVLKDPICLFALGILVYNTFVDKKKYFLRLLYVILSSFLILKIKPYIFYTFSIAFLGGGLIFYFSQYKTIVKASILFLFFTTILIFQDVLLGYATESIDDIAKESQKNIEFYKQLAQSGDTFIIPTLDSTPFGFIKFSIEGFINVFLKPYPWQINKIVYLFVIIENIMMFYILFLKVHVIDFVIKKKQGFFIKFSIIFFITLGIVVGVTTFNLGTTARYRVPALPFLFGGIYAIKIAYASKRKVSA
jgi:hypothetical protein